MYERAPIDAALARYDRHFRGPYYETVMNRIVEMMASGYGRKASR